MDDEFKDLVDAYYEGLYRFALSLSHNQDDASDLTQETFCRYATKGAQLRDRSKVRSWLFTTLYRLFLGWRRRETRLPHFEIDTVAHELPPTSPETMQAADAHTLLNMVRQLDERYRAPLMLFYIEDFSYKEIAKVLEIPTGTVMSRLSRAKAMLREMLAASSQDETSSKVVPMNSPDLSPRQSYSK